MHDLIIAHFSRAKVKPPMLAWRPTQLCGHGDARRLVSTGSHYRSGEYAPGFGIISFLYEVRHLALKQKQLVHTNCFCFPVRISASNRKDQTDFAKSRKLEQWAELVVLMEEEAVAVAEVVCPVLL